MHMLAGRAKRFATRREDAYARRTCQELLRQVCGCIDNMLAAIEDDQHPLFPQHGYQPRIVGVHRQPERCSERTRNELRIFDGRQVHKPNSVLVFGKEHLG
jgi:hypothetical protein